MDEDKESGKLYIGTAGWSYRDWEGTFYPSVKPDRFRPLSYVARFFNTVEINSTFYSPVGPTTTRKWIEAVADNPDFLFTAKLWQRFTHESTDPPNLPDRDAVRDADQGFRPILDAGKLGALLLQFPYSFHNGARARERLLEIARAFADYPLVVEVRHASWDTRETLEFFHEHNLNFCNVDQPAIGKSLPPTAHLTGPVGYVRLHGRNYEHWFPSKEQRASGGTDARDRRYDYLYNEAELDEWTGRVRKLRTKAKATFVIANNHYRGQAPANALQLIRKLTGSTPALPEALKKTYPFLAKGR